MAEAPHVAIMGASGFIGLRLTESLHLRNLASVRPILRSYRSMARLARFDLDCRLADANDPAGLAEQLRGCSLLFHCVVGDRNTILRSAEAAYRAAAAAGVRRLVYLSSAVVHGHNPTLGTHDESPLVAKQAFEYNVSKVMAEHLLRRLRGDGKVEVVTLRPSIVFGPRSQYWTAQIAAALLDGKAYLVDGGNGICNTVFVDNLVDAMWLSASMPQAANQDLVITDGERVTWRDLYSAVAKAVGVEMTTVASISVETAQELYNQALQQQRLQHMKDSRVARIAREWLPARVKQLVRAQIGARVPAPTLQHKPAAPVIDCEMSSLQRCHYILPVEKARRILGYNPRVSFAEACERTALWLRFALGLDA